MLSKRRRRVVASIATVALAAAGVAVVSVWRRDRACEAMPAEVSPVSGPTAAPSPDEAVLVSSINVEMEPPFVGILIGADGRVVVKRLDGYLAASLSPRTIDALRECLRSDGFASLADDYKGFRTPSGPLVCTSPYDQDYAAGRASGATKRVRTDLGVSNQSQCMASLPDPLRDLLEVLGEIETRVAEVGVPAPPPARVEAFGF